MDYKYIAKGTFPQHIYWISICCNSWLIHEKQEFYRVYQHGGWIPVGIWGGKFNSNSEPKKGVVHWEPHANKREATKSRIKYQVCSDAVGAGVDLVSKDFSFNWDYIQSCFFSLTILTTIGVWMYCQYLHTMQCKGLNLTVYQELNMSRVLFGLFFRVWKFCQIIALPK